MTTQRLQRRCGRQNTANRRPGWGAGAGLRPAGGCGRTQQPPCLCGSVKVPQHHMSELEVDAQRLSEGNLSNVLAERPAWGSRAALQPATSLDDLFAGCHADSDLSLSSSSARSLPQGGKTKPVLRNEIVFAHDLARYELVLLGNFSSVKTNG